MMIIRSFLFLICLASFSNCDAQQNHREAPSAGDSYTYGAASRDGIGKFYMGREIAHVMGHLAAGWLERPEREREENVSRAIRNMKLQGDEQIADIGAGSGYYTFRLAEQLPDGKVYAVDIQPEMLDIMRRRIKKDEITNVELVRGSETSPNLPENTIDMAFMVDVYHELSHPRELMQEVVRALKPGGRFILLEYRKEDPWVPIKELHKMSEKQAVEEMAAVGLRLERNIGNLPWQHFMVFVKE